MARHEVPELTDEQRRANLTRAVEARRVRKAALDEVRRGTLGVRAALDDPRLARCKVFAWLRAIPGIGTARAKQVMTRAQVKPSRRVAGLGIRQRGRLVRILEDRGASGGES